MAKKNFPLQIESVYISEHPDEYPLAMNEDFLARATLAQSFTHEWIGATPNNCLTYEMQLVRATNYLQKFKLIGEDD